MSFIIPARTRPSLSERVLARLGTLLEEKYRIERLLGIGGTAAVYAASHRNGHRVAIKYLHDRFADDAGVRHLFKREAYVANRVGHPGAVPVLDDGVDEEGCPYLIMPHLEGETLRRRWERANKRLPAIEVGVLMAYVLDVLAAAHANGIVHGDIKPDNLFITDAGQVRVLDFGIARCIALEVGATSTGGMMGAPAFMPPEQAVDDRKAIGPHTDCWAVGATIFAILSGEFVHRAENARALLAAAATRHARSLADVMPGLPLSLVPLVRFVDKALAFDPLDRWPSAGEMRHALDVVLEEAIGRPMAAVATEVRARLSLERPPSTEQLHVAAERAVELELRRGRAALERLEGAWSSADSPPAPESAAQALAAIERALAAADDPEMRLLAGELSYVTSDFDRSRNHLQAAFQRFMESRNRRRAAIAASWLGYVYSDGIGNAVASKAWLKRASRLVDDEPPCVEQGWVALAMVGCFEPDPVEVQANAALAFDRARRFGDVHLEIRALAETGLALVSLGNVRDGMASIDEAMVMALHEVTYPAVLSHAACCMLSACDRVGDLARAEAWLRASDESGYVGPHSALHTAHCASTYARLLCQVGRWPEAERALATAHEAGRRSSFGARVLSFAAAADLRIWQGRLEDAEHLLKGLEDRFESLGPLARLHLARQEYDLAVAVARRGLRLLSANRTESVALLSVSISAALALGDRDAAASALAEMSILVAGTEQPALRAEAALSHARVRAAHGERAAAITGLYAALADLGGAELPLIRAAIHVELAVLHAGTDRPTAISEARAARAIYSRLGAVEPPALTALETGRSPEASRSPTPRPPEEPPRLDQDGEYWTLHHEGREIRLKDSKGLQYLAMLLREPAREFHVGDLVHVGSEAAMNESDLRGSGLRVGDLGDAGACLDPQAKAAYQQRLAHLADALEDAEKRGDSACIAGIRAEREALADELARAVGLGGRYRKAGAAAERARVNVQRRLRDVVSRVSETDAVMGRHIARHLKTGVFCSWEP